MRLGIVYTLAIFVAMVTLCHTQTTADPAATQAATAAATTAVAGAGTTNAPTAAATTADGSDPTTDPTPPPTVPTGPTVPTAPSDPATTETVAESSTTEPVMTTSGDEVVDVRSEPNPPPLDVTDAEFFGDVPCDVDDVSNCTTVAHTVCDNNTLEESYCRCKVEEYWTKSESGDKCVLQQGLGEVCVDGLSIADDPNAVCEDDGSNTGTTRYRCKNQGAEYIPVLVDLDDTYSEYQCAEVLTEQDAADCRNCTDNTGVCYAIPESDGSFAIPLTKSGCKCPVSRSGDDCEEVHVEVICDLEKFSMKVCYQPHPGMDVTKLTMYVDSKSNVPECLGAQVPVTDPIDPRCLAGSYLVELPMKQGERTKCGTTEIFSGIDTKKFENKIVVTDTVNTKIFKTYCSVQTHSSQSLGAIGVIGINGNDRGEHLNPDLTFSIENPFGAEISRDQIVQLNDKVRFRIQLTDDGTYSALVPTHCTASDSGSLSDPKANTIPLIKNGCPVTTTTHITDANNWHRLAGQANVIQTGIIKMFKTPSSTSLFIHCTVKLCLVGTEDDCKPETEESCNAASSRRKRAVGDEDLNTRDVQTSLIVYDPNGNPAFSMTTIEFSIIIAVLVAVAVIAMVGAIAMYIWIIKFRKNKIGDNVEMTQKPQRFALPRVNVSSRSHMRL